MPARFHPRDFLSEPQRFGRDRDALWRPSPTVEDVWGRAEYRMSWRQHNAAISMKQLLEFWGVNVAWLASQIFENTDYLRRKLHGEVPIRLEDWFVWSELAGQHAREPGLDCEESFSSWTCDGFEPPQRLIDRKANPATPLPAEVVARQRVLGQPATAPAHIRRPLINP